MIPLRLYAALDRLARRAFTKDRAQKGGARSFGAAPPLRHDPGGIHAKLMWPGQKSRGRPGRFPARLQAPAPAFNEHRVFAFDVELGEGVDQAETHRNRMAAKRERRARRAARV